MDYASMVALASDAGVSQRMVACAATLRVDQQPGAWVAFNQWALTAAMAAANPTVTAATVTDDMITAAVKQVGGLS